MICVILFFYCSQNGLTEKSELVCLMYTLLKRCRDVDTANIINRCYFEAIFWYFYPLNN